MVFSLKILCRMFLFGWLVQDDESRITGYLEEIWFIPSSMKSVADIVEKSKPYSSKYNFYLIF